jgi:hypothetical protein
VKGLYYNILYHMDQLLGNDSKTNYTTTRKLQQNIDFFWAVCAAVISRTVRFQSVELSYLVGE